MKQFSLFLALATCAVISCSTLDRAQTQNLFNGRDLTGWVAEHGGGWSVENGVLVGRNGTNWSTNPEVSGSWLRTEKEYSDFDLDFEYAINTGGNSGVFIRSAIAKNPAFTGHEMQILADFEKLASNHGTGSLYDVVAPTKNLSRPHGEWNQVKIVCRGRHIEITMNGEKVINYDTDRLTRGYIGLQNHDTKSVVKFRNIRIRDLGKTRSQN